MRVFIYYKFITVTVNTNQLFMFKKTFDTFIYL